MNNRLFHTIAASLASLSTQLLKVAGKRAGAANEFPTRVAHYGRTSTDSRNLEPERATKTLPSVRRWPQALGPFVMMILTLRRDSSVGTDYGKQENAPLPEGALFVVRYRSR